MVIIADRRFDHRHTVLDRRLGGLVRWIARRYEQHTIQVQCIGSNLREDQVTDMGRIECPAQNSG